MLIKNALLVMIAMSFVACQPVTETPPPKEYNLPIPPVINPETRVAPPEARAALSKVVIDNPTCRQAPSGTAKHPVCNFTLTYAQSNPFLEGLQPGNVLVSEPSTAAPAGYLIKVVSNTGQGTGRVIKGLQAALGDAITEGEIAFKKSLKPSDLASSKSLRPSVHALSDKFGFAFDEILYDEDSNTSTTDDQIRVQGDFNFEYNDGITADVTWKKKWGIPLYPNGVYLRAAVGIRQSANISVISKLTKKIEKSIELKSYTFDSFTIFVGPVPLVFVPKIVVSVNAVGQATAKLEYSAHEKFNALAGVEYDDGFNNISELTPIKDIFSSELKSAEATGKFDGNLGIRAELLLYDIVGPYIEISGGVQVDAATKRNPFWILNGSVAMRLGLYVDLYFDTLDYSTELFKSSFKIGESENQPPTVKFGNIDGGKIQLGKLSCVGVSTFDLEDDNGQLATGPYPTVVSSVDGPLTDNAKCGFLGFGFTPLTEGPRTITASVSDSKGKTASASVTLIAENSPPTAFIVKPKPNATIYSGQKIFLQGYSVDGNEKIDCSTVKPGRPTIVFSSNVAADLMPTACPETGAEAIFNGVGSHTLTVTTTDTQGAVGTKSVTFNVLPVPNNYPPDITLLEPQIIDPAKVPTYSSTSQIIPFRYRVSDTDSPVLTFTWKIKKTPTSPATVYVPSLATPLPGNTPGGQELSFALNTNTLPPGPSCSNCIGLSGEDFIVILEIADGGNIYTFEQNFHTANYVIPK
jgi:hypothetical protein